MSKVAPTTSLVLRLHFLKRHPSSNGPQPSQQNFTLPKFAAQAQLGPGVGNQIPGGGSDPNPETPLRQCKPPAPLAKRPHSDRTAVSETLTGPNRQHSLTMYTLLPCGPQRSSSCLAFPAAPSTIANSAPDTSILESRTSSSRGCKRLRRSTSVAQLERWNAARSPTATAWSMTSASALWWWLTTTRLSWLLSRWIPMRSVAELSMDHCASTPRAPRPSRFLSLCASLCLHQSQSLDRTLLHSAPRLPCSRPSLPPSLSPFRLRFPAQRGLRMIALLTASNASLQRRGCHVPTERGAGPDGRMDWV
jgi:hypothetical protein